MCVRSWGRDKIDCPPTPPPPPPPPCLSIPKDLRLGVHGAGCIIEQDQHMGAWHG